jgi:hypothetical protein
MKRLGLVLLSFVLATSALAQTEPTRTIEQAFPLGEHRSVEIGLAFGSVTVLAEPREDVRVLLEVYCEKAERDRAKCGPHAADLALTFVSNGDELVLGVDGVSQAVNRKLRVWQEVRVPENLPVEIDVRDGSVRVAGARGDLKISLFKGDVDLLLADDAVHQLELKAGGETSVRRGEIFVQGGGTLSSSLRWTDGGGTAKVVATSRIGSVRTVLE